MFFVAHFFETGSLRVLLSRQIVFMKDVRNKKTR